MNNQWSYKLGHFVGIAVYLHWTFFLVPALIAFSTLGAGGGFVAAIEAVAFVLAIFGCVVLHEYGHALMARHYGIHTQDITLYPIGGVARLDRIPENPKQELSVALAGPAVNVVIATVLTGGLILAAVLGLVPSFLSAFGTFFGNLILVNVALVVFNMLPAFPMDGGRVLRSILAMNMNYVRATEIAATVGQVMAVLLGVIGLFGNWTLILIAVFVYFAAGAELHYARMRTPVEPIFEPQPPHETPVYFKPLRAEWQLASVSDAIMTSPMQRFPVMSGPNFVGMLFKGDVMRALANGWGHLTVAEVMHKH